MNKKHLFEVAKAGVKDAIFIANNFMLDAKVISSDEKDIKTQADISINDFLINFLSKADSAIPILSEEGLSNNLIIPNLCWIIDPLDGTYNFTRKFPHAAVSICLWENEEPIIGVIGDIFTGSIYSCLKGCGAYKDGIKIKVSDIDLVENGTLATGFPSGSSYAKNDLFLFVEQVQSFKKIRAIGSACLMLCMVADGIFDAYSENDIYLWDVAAGMALVKEAGGAVFYKRRKGTFKYQILASNFKLFKSAKLVLNI